MDLKSPTFLRLPGRVILFKWGAAFVGVIVVGAVFFGGYDGLNRITSMFGSTTIVPVALDGTLFLSAMITSTSPEGAATPLSIAVPVSDITGMQDLAVQSGGVPVPAFQLSMSNDATRVVFTDAFPKSILFSIDIGTGATVDNLLENATPLLASSEADHFRGAPSISSANIVLYSSLGASDYKRFAPDLNEVPAEVWNIYAVDGNGEGQVLTHGLQPKWIDNERFAYLKNDGVYVFDILTKSEAKVWSLDYVPTVANGFDVSNDGQFLAISDPKMEILSIVRALNWDSGLLATVVDISIVTSNVVFSPDDRYLAVVVTQENLDTSVQGKDVVYYSLEDKGFLSNLLSFGFDTVGSMYLTDWR